MISTYAGDAFWVIGLSIMFSASTRASNRTAGDSHLTVMGSRIPRGLALWAIPGGSFALSLWLAFTARTADVDALGALMMLALRALLAALLPLGHLRLLAEVTRPPKR